MIIALAATGLAALVRALPWPPHLAKRKPLACATCMGWWAAIGVGGALALIHGATWWSAFEVAAAAGLATVLLAQTGLFVTPLDLGP